jgi:NADPH:quinone reductase-like Zn-dependent oxidoreductase
MGYIFKAFFLSILMHKQKRPYIAIPKNKQLVDMRELVETGKIKPVIDQIYPLKKTPEAMEYVGKGHAKGKVVISMKAEK